MTRLRLSCISSIIALEKHSILKHRMRSFLLNQRKKPHDYRDCTSELNPPSYVFRPLLSFPGTWFKRKYPSRLKTMIDDQIEIPIHSAQLSPRKALSFKVFFAKQDTKPHEHWLLYRIIELYSTYQEQYRVNNKIFSMTYKH